jgi:DNA-binding transcriptional LysR family regulator
MYTDHSLNIAKGLVDGYVDVGCILENSEAAAEIADLAVNELDEPFAWVRARDFALSPGAPIPLVTWPGDDMMVRALTKNQSTYKIVFNSPDFHAKIMALEAGLGIAALPRRSIPPALVEAREHYLPELPPAKKLLCARMELEHPQAETLLRRLTKTMFQPTAKV